MPTNKSNNFRMFEKEREASSPMVAALSSRLVSLRKQNIAASLADFEGSAHKLELVKTINGIDFVDDSRSTNINAVWYSLQSMKKPTVWITSINEVEKITDDLVQTIREKVKAIVVQGVYNTDVYDFFNQLEIPVMVELSLEDAVCQAFYASDKGYTVLFSPGVNGTANQTYRERGDRFKAATGQL